MAKKDFKTNNPALSFMSTAEPETFKENEKLIHNKKVPDGYKLNPEYIETKSKRVQLLLQPSVVDAIKTLAKKQGLSMNETISQAIQDYVERHTK